MPTHAPHCLTALPFDATVATPIQTERLTLRPLTVADADDVFAYQERADVVEHLPWLVRNREESLEHTTTRSATTRLENDGDALVLAMELPAAGGPGTPSRVIGDLSLFLRSVENAQLEVGWVLHPEFHGKGYASEATTALLELCFSTLGAHRVRAELAPENTASGALCRRLGMRHEAHLVEFEVFKGVWGDLDIYAMLDSEWLARA